MQGIKIKSMNRWNKREEKEPRNRREREKQSNR